MPSPSNPGLPYKAAPTRNVKDHWGFYMTEHAGLYQALDSTTGGLAALGVAARDAAISGGLDKFWALADSLSAACNAPAAGEVVTKQALYGGLSALESALNSKDEVEARNVAALVCVAFAPCIPSKCFSGMWAQIDALRTIADSLLDDALSAEVSGIAEQLAVEAQALAVLGNPA